MALIRSFRGKQPVIGPDTFVAETAALIGDVRVGSRSSLWYGAILRGDVYHIRIGDDTSIQDNTVVHVTSGRHATSVGDRVTVGHSAVLHGCTIEDDCIIGMGAIIMDRAHIGRFCVVGAGALVTPDTLIEEGQLVLGTPARAKRALTEEERGWIQTSARHYVELARQYLEGAESTG
ncbi:MAG TPA: gamma carbonic anhydrase family protein [Kofleriaceae bacterium]|nr:gamma carbonic anhydrase family protein [Kofleriaceae bacterium]